MDDSSNSGENYVDSCCIQGIGFLMNRSVIYAMFSGFLVAKGYFESQICQNALRIYRVTASAAAVDNALSWRHSLSEA